MRSSEQFNEIATALAKAQGEMRAPQKNKTANAGTYSYSYADLSEIVDCVRGPLSKNGLCFIHALNPAGEDYELCTRLIHSSGQWLESGMSIKRGVKPQEFGSALSYCKRYTLSALLGIAAEDDDDGKAASTSKTDDLNKKYVKSS